MIIKKNKNKKLTILKYYSIIEVEKENQKNNLNLIMSSNIFCYFSRVYFIIIF